MAEIRLGCPPTACYSLSFTSQHHAMKTHIYALETPDVIFLYSRTYQLPLTSLWKCALKNVFGPGDFYLWYHLWPWPMNLILISFHLTDMLNFNTIHTVNSPILFGAHWASVFLSAVKIDIRTYRLEVELFRLFFLPFPDMRIARLSCALKFVWQISNKIHSNRFVSFLLEHRNGFNY